MIFPFSYGFPMVLPLFPGLFSFVEPHLGPAVDAIGVQLRGTDDLHAAEALVLRENQKVRDRGPVNGHFRILKWRYLPYIRPIEGLCKGISPQNMALYGTVPPFLDPGIPIDR